MNLNMKMRMVKSQFINIFYLGDHKVQGTILIAGTIKFVGLNK